MLAAGFRGYLTPLAIEEDDKKITVMVMPYGGGGRAIINDLYNPPENLAMLNKPQKLTFSKTNVPIYCTHCALQDIIPIEATGYPIWIIEPPHEFGKEPCRFHTYKAPENIPAKYYERYGLKKLLKNKVRAI